MSDTDELAELIRIHGIGRKYMQALEEAGLFDPEGGYSTEDFMKKARIQSEFNNGNNLPMFFLEKIETKFYADRLVDELIEEHGGMNGLGEEEFWRRYWGKPNHDRDLPDMILTLVEEDVLDAEAKKELMEHAWMHTEFPSQNAEPDRWIDAFSAAGWVSDDESERPTEPILLYRGAEFDYALGMSWTADPERAEWFAKRWKSNGEVFVCLFQPHELLAKFFGRGESEYVVATEWIDDHDRVRSRRLEVTIDGEPINITKEN